MFEDVKKTLLKMLSTELHGYTLFFEDILKLNDQIEKENIKNYVYVELAPIVRRTINKCLSEHVMIVSITVHSEISTNENYQSISKQLDKQVRPVFFFDDRAITIPELNSNIHDDSLYITFTMSVLDGEELEDEESFMEVL